MTFCLEIDLGKDKRLDKFIPLSLSFICLLITRQNFLTQQTNFCFFLVFFQNSIRHNLSLHNRFMRVQNEGTGKSSWWMLNPEAKPGKSVRRRAASMETSRYEKRRGRAKKRAENMRQGGVVGPIDATPSPSSSVSEGLDHFPESPLHR